MFARQLSRRALRVVRSRRQSSTRNAFVEVDSCALPLKPTWSVNELLSSYPRPEVTSPTLNRLHELSALIPPEEGTEKHAALKQELEDLVRLVEAVKLVKLDEEITPEGAVPDGRIWRVDEGVRAVEIDKEVAAADGSTLLRHASRTADGMYLVDTDRTT